MDLEEKAALAQRKVEYMRMMSDLPSCDLKKGFEQGIMMMQDTVRMEIEQKLDVNKKYSPREIIHLLDSMGK